MIPSRHLHDMWNRLVRDVVNAVTMTWLIPDPLRVFLLRAWGVDVSGARVSSHCFFGGTDIRIGVGTYLNRGVYIDNNASVTIGERCSLGMDTLIVTSHHTLGPAMQRATFVTGVPVRIGDGCWIGARVTILPGVSIADGCVVAAGAVVTADCDPNGLYVGVPARRVRDL